MKPKWLLAAVGGLLLGVSAYKFHPLARSYLTGLEAPPPPAGLAAGRPAGWATPLDRPGLSNLHRVTDDLYRGAQPTQEGMRQLQKMGIRTVVNLRAFHSDDDELEGVDVQGRRITFEPWRARDGEVVEFLRIAADRSRTPVFVHCQHGADRTGTMVAVYRMAIGGWSKEDAIAEMVHGGFGFHRQWRNLIQYLRELDVEALKRQAGLPPAGAPTTPATAP